jgi:hypothetical protein
VVALILQQGSIYQSVARVLISMQAHGISIHGPSHPQPLTVSQFFKQAMKL